MARKYIEDVFKKFESIRNFYKYLDESKMQPGARDESFTGTRSFTGTKDYTQASDLLLFGDYDLQRKVESLGVKKLKANLNKYMNKRTFVSAVVGAAPNVPSYVSGSPNSMIAVRTHRVRQNVINVFYNCAVSCMVGADEITEAVTRLVCALIRLEASGTRVNLYCGTLGESGGQRVSFAVKIKDSGQKFDTLKMVYPMAHPSFNRRHKFRFVEVTEGVKSTWYYGYGSSETDDSKTKAFLDAHGCKVDAVFNYRTLERVSVDSIVDGLEERINNK